MNTDTKQSSNEAENGNKSKPLLSSRLNSYKKMKKLSPAQKKVVDILVKYPTAYIIKSPFYNHNDLVVPKEVSEYPIQFTRPTFEFLERNGIIEFLNSKKYILSSSYKAGVSGSVLSTETRYYLFENNSTNETEINFISQILLFSEKVQKFNCGLGEFILGITSKFDDSCESEDADVLDIIFNFRKQIAKKKEYTRKPNPQRYWEGEWEVLINENFV